MMVTDCNLLELFLLPNELPPTVVMYEDEEQEQADDYLCQTDGIEPFAKAYLHVMLDGDADKIVEHDKRAMHPAKFVGNRQDGYQDQPQERVFEYETEKQALADCHLHHHVRDEPERTENWQKAYEYA